MINTKLKRLISAFISLAVILILINQFYSLSNLSKSEETTLADGFTISAYNVVLDVNEDNTIDVTENLTVNFTSGLKHGIYKLVPQWLEYTAQNGETVKRKSLVENLRAEGDDYFVDKVKKKARIKIGNSSEYVGYGQKTYVIKYTYNMGADPYDGFDEFIFHTFGDYWGTEIKNATIEINMPKSIDDATINFFFDKYRANSANDYVDYTISENSIYVSFDRDKYYQEEGKSLTKSLTVDIELPEGYFTGGSWNYGFGSFILTMIVLAITLWNFFNWKKYGKDHPKISETVEFYPPENLSSAEIGYIYGRQSNKKLTISLIVELACKGYIKIDEVEVNGKKEIQITNLVDKLLYSCAFDATVEDRVIKVKKLKEIDKNFLDEKETTLMNYLFKDGNEKEITSNMDIGLFLLKKDSLTTKGFVEVISDNEDTRYDEYNKKKEEYDKYIENYKNNLVEHTAEKESGLNPYEAIVYNKLFVNENEIILSEHLTFYTVFAEIEKMLEKNLFDLVDDKNSRKKMRKSALMTILVVALSLLSYCLVEDLDPNWSFLYYLAFICMPVNLFLTIIMGRKTEYGERIFAKIKGFRNFLETVEKDKLEALVSEDPSYFYNILPYTYALNISKTWIEKFENISMPKMDIGNFDYSNINSFNSIYDNVYVPHSSSSSSSGGCSSCGGGCSSCGGGCSSCGGGGSW